MNAQKGFFVSGFLLSEAALAGNQLQALVFAEPPALDGGDFQFC
jgi:hypothetical protein